MGRDRHGGRSRRGRASCLATAALAFAIMGGMLAPVAPVEAAGEPTRGALSGIACTSTTLCIAVGSISSINTSASQVLIMRWDGSNWTRVPVANPAGATYPSLTSISCPSATRCFAVGSYSNGTDNRTLIEHWDGNRWSVAASPNLTTPGSTLLSSVSCPSTTSCFAVGYTINAKANTAVVTHWNGTSWSIAPLVRPAGASIVFLSGISCPSATRCFAAGTYEDKHQDIKPLIYRWNGLGWKIMAGPTFAGRAYPALNDIACPTPTSCYIAGSITTRYGIRTTRRVIEHWDGTRWSLTNFPLPKYPSTWDVLVGVSCVNDTSCIAVGYIERGPAITVAERWDGTHWKVVPSPNQDAQWTELDRVACPAATSCTAVGRYEQNESKPLAQQWDGARWSTTFAPPQPAP